MRTVDDKSSGTGFFHSAAHTCQKVICQNFRGEFENSVKCFVL